MTWSAALATVRAARCSGASTLGIGVVGPRREPLRGPRGTQLADISDFSLNERGIMLRSLREGIDYSTAVGRMVARIFAAGTGER